MTCAIMRKDGMTVLKDKSRAMHRNQRLSQVADGSVWCAFEVTYTPRRSRGDCDLAWAKLCRTICHGQENGKVTTLLSHASDVSACQRISLFFKFHYTITSSCPVLICELELEVSDTQTNLHAALVTCPDVGMSFLRKWKVPWAKFSCFTNRRLGSSTFSHNSVVVSFQFLADVGKVLSLR